MPGDPERTVGGADAGDDTGSSRRGLLATMGLFLGSAGVGSLHMTDSLPDVADAVGLGRSRGGDDGAWSSSGRVEETDRTEHSEPPSDPVAYFATTDGSVFPDWHLSQYPALDGSSALDRPFFHPDTNAFEVEFDPATEVLTVGFDACFARPVRLGTVVRGPGFPDADGEHFDPGSSRTTVQDLEPTGDADLDGQPGVDDLERYRLAFDLDGVDFPEDVSTHVYVCMLDRYWLDTDVERESYAYRVLANRNLVRFSYTDLDGMPRTRWIDDEELTPVVTEREERGGSSVFDRFEVDDGDVAVTYGLVKRPDGFWGAGFPADVAEMESYRRNGDDGTRHQIHAAHAAYRDPRWRNLAAQIWDAQTEVGVTDVYARVNDVAQFVQILPYREQVWRKPGFHLYAGWGNCSAKTAIFASILRCEPFDVRVGYLFCRIRELGDHLVAGVDVGEFAGSDRDVDALDTLRVPEDVDALSGFPEGEYAFVELTDPYRNVGEYDPRRYELYNFGTTNYGEGDPYL